MMLCTRLLIAYITDDKLGAGGNGPSKTGRQIVEHHRVLAGVEELENDVATNVAGATGY